MIKKLLVAIFIFSALTGNAQLNNSWIDYNKTYFKFKVNSDTLCRISQVTLSNIGLGSTPAQNFQLWRNGQEVRIYTSVAAGPMSSSDYIEFWGEADRKSVV